MPLGGGEVCGSTGGDAGDVDCGLGGWFLANSAITAASNAASRLFSSCEDNLPMSFHLAMLLQYKHCARYPLKAVYRPSARSVAMRRRSTLHALFQSRSRFAALTLMMSLMCRCESVRGA